MQPGDKRCATQAGKANADRTPGGVRGTRLSPRPSRGAVPHPSFFWGLRASTLPLAIRRSPLRGGNLEPGTPRRTPPGPFVDG